MQTDDFFNQRKPYFTTPALKALMQQLHHLAFFGDGVSLVEGDAGSGKSAMVEELAKLFDGVSEFFSLTIPPDAELGESMGEIGAALGLLNDNALTVGEVLAQLRHYSQSLVQDKKLSVICIDDAHHLDDQAVGALLSLLQGREEHNYGLHFIFFAQPGLVDQIDALHIIDVPVYDFALPELSVEELERFVTTVAPSKLPTEPKAVAKLHAISAGNPGTVLKLLGQASEEKGRASTEPQASVEPAQFKEQFAQVAGRMEEKPGSSERPSDRGPAVSDVSRDSREDFDSDHFAAAGAGMNSFAADDSVTDGPITDSFDDDDDFTEDRVHLSSDYHENLLADDEVVTAGGAKHAHQDDEHVPHTGANGLDAYIEKAKALLDRFLSLPATHLAAISLLAAILLWSVFFSGSDDAPKPVVSSVPLPTLTEQKTERVAAIEDGSRILQLGEREQPAGGGEQDNNPAETEELIGTATPSRQQNEQNVLVSKLDEQQQESGAASTARPTPLPVAINTPAIAPPAAVTPPVQAPAAQNAVKQAGVAGKPTSDERYLLGQSNEAFTLQVLAASKHDSLTRYIARQPNKDDLHMYRGTREGKSWYVVVANVYPSKEAALKARNKLPQEQVNAGPWPRKLSAIQEEIKTYLKKHPE